MEVAISGHPVRRRRLIGAVRPGDDRLAVCDTRFVLVAIRPPAVLGEE